ncbi:MAG: discoidin domain-containing protein, partial [Planctomycetales bacterium]|nr:discoidin domain-containing protein [Planctomycetales bacterium]
MIRTQLTVALILLGWTGASVHGQIDTITVTHPINVALDGTATASGATWAGWDPNFIIDGDIGSINHASEPVEQFGYTIELPSVVAFDQINVVGRNSDCCVNRLTNYRVAILDDAAGMPGAVLWSADVRTDGSNSGPGGVDELLADRDPAGTFAGRWVSVSKIPNPAEVDYYLQIAEVELLSGTATETIPINYAAGASVTPSAPTWHNWVGPRIVDGNTSAV